MEHQRILNKVIATDSTDTVGIAADPKGPVVVAADLNDPAAAAVVAIASLWTSRNANFSSLANANLCKIPSIF